MFIICDVTNFEDEKNFCSKNSIDLLICIHPNHIIMHSKFNLLLVHVGMKVWLRSLILTKQIDVYLFE